MCLADDIFSPLSEEKKVTLNICMSALSLLHVCLSTEHILTKIAVAHRNVGTQMKICCFLAHFLSYYNRIFSLYAFCS